MSGLREGMQGGKGKLNKFARAIKDKAEVIKDKADSMQDRMMGKVRQLADRSVSLSRNGSGMRHSLDGAGGSVAG